jgi:DNA-directed RNA polymerase specialized sigma24 family protein
MAQPEGEERVFPNSEAQADGSVVEPAGSLAAAIARYKQGDTSALGEMMFACYRWLVARADGHLRNVPSLRSFTDGEELAASAMGSYYRAVGDGKYRDMKHGNELRALLAKIVDHKVSHQIRKHNTVKAGGGKVRNMPEAGLDRDGREPPPPDVLLAREAWAQTEDVLTRWRNLMKKNGLLDVANLVMEGHSSREVARTLGIGVNKARRQITLVNALTRDGALEETSEP